MQTPLHIAANTNNLKILKKLILMHAYINAVDQLNRTPLYLAAKNNYVIIVIVKLSMTNRN